MRRIIMLGTVALVMAAMLAVSDSAAFAKLNCHYEGSTKICSGGHGGQGGGAGGHTSTDFTTGAYEISGGVGSGVTRFGAGRHCEGTLGDPVADECSGRFSSGNQ